MRGFSNTHSKGEEVKIPLLPNKVGKKEQDNDNGHNNHHFPYANISKISTICQSAKYILELYIRLEFTEWKTSAFTDQATTSGSNQVLIFTEKFLPLPGFELGTSPEPSLYTTNWAILAWIIFNSLIIN